MDKCNICGKVLSKASKGMHMAYEHGSMKASRARQAAQARERYYARPLTCLQCRKVIPFVRAPLRKRKFCSRSCGAIYNNALHPKKEKKLTSAERSALYHKEKIEMWKRGEDISEFSNGGKTHHAQVEFFEDDLL